jgi:hypothetical protein
MSIVVHLLLTIVVLFCAVSYLATGYATFFSGDSELRKSSFFFRFFFFAISPLIVLDVIIEKIFGKSLLS